MLDVLGPHNYSLTIYALPMLAVGAAIALLGLFVLIREHRSRVGILFLTLCSSIALYLFATGVNYASLDDKVSLFWIKISQLGAVFIPSTILVLTLDRLGLLSRFRFAIAAGIALSTFLASGIFFTDLHVRGSARFFWGNFVQYGPLGFVFIGFFFSTMIFILRLHWQEYRRSTTERNKKRFRGLLIAFGGGYLGAVDFIPTLGISFYPFGYIPLLFFMVMSAYVVIRYHLADITPELAANEILETMQGAVIVVDREGRIRVVNRVALELLGYLKSELLGRDLASVLTVPGALVEAVRSGRRAAAHEVVWVGKGEQQHDVSLSASLLTDDRNETPLGVVYVAHDITARKRAEDALFQEKTFSDTVINSLPGIFYVYDETGHLVRWNNNHEAKTGYSADELRRRNFLDWFRKDEQLRIQEDFQSVLQDGEAAGEYHLVIKDGTNVPYFLTGSRFTMAGKRYVIGVGIDITERKRADEELHQAGKELQDFAYIVSHDLRAPLVNIQGFSEELARSLAEIGPCFEKHLPMLDEAEKQRIGPLLKQDIPEALGFIRSSVTRMDNLIGAILKLSRAGRRKLSPEPLQTGELVREILKTLTHQLGSRAVTVTVGALPDLVADRMAMEQLFGNLLDNAVKYLDPGRPGEIAVTAEEREGKAVFHVRDNGRGMEQEDIPRAFEIFRRVGKQDMPGDGMGLAYVKALVRGMGGRIWCESEPGRGSVFSFSIRDANDRHR
jgi:PAS domain S-box-containing protein